MDDPTRISRLLLGSAATMATAANARAIIVPIDALPELETIPGRAIFVIRDEHDRKRLENLEASDKQMIELPNVELDRFGQIKLAAIFAISNGLIGYEDTVIFLAGPFRSLIDSIVVMTIGSEYELFDTTEQPELEAEPIKRAVFHRVLTLALQIGQHGREGRKTGALFVVGDTEAVLSHTEQMILNPFKGYPEAERNILDDTMAETVKEFSIIDGAFVIRRNGVIETAGARMKVGVSTGLPSGLGARHAAAAGITVTTKAIAMTVSQTDGTVRVWRAGKMVASFEPSNR